MKYLGTHNTAAEAGEFLLRTGFSGIARGSSTSEAYQKMLELEYAAAQKEGDDDRAEELSLDALETAGRRIVLLDPESGETITTEELVKALDGVMLFEMWSTKTNTRHLMADTVGVPANGWRDIEPHEKRAALDWQESIHTQDGALRLAHLFHLMQAGR